MRYNRLQDLGLTEQQIRDNLIFTGAKVGDLMKTAMDPKDAKEWFGARAAGSDRDRALALLARRQRRGLALHLPARLLPRPVAPDRLEQHRLSERRHAARAVAAAGRAGAEDGGASTLGRGRRDKDEVQKLVLEKPGTMTPAEYDRMVADLVNFLVYMGEPARHAARRRSASTCS